MKTPFIIAANKTDNLSGWNSQGSKKLLDNIESQRQDVIYKLEEKVYELVAKVSEFGYDSDRFDRIDDFTKKIAIVPISAKTGEGITELLSTLVGLTQKYMEKKLTIENENISRGVILEVKDYVGLGKTIDVILYDGVMKTDDIVLALDTDGVQRSKLKSILKPNELKEIRDASTKFNTIKEVYAAAGVKLSCPEFVDIKAGMPIITLRKTATSEEIETYTKELEKQNAEINIENADEGVLIKADTLGSLEAISFILKEHNIPVRRAKIGKITKGDIMDVSVDLETNPKNALLLNFSQKMDEDIVELAKKSNVTIFSSQTTASSISL